MKEVPAGNVQHAPLGGGGGMAGMSGRPVLNDSSLATVFQKEIDKSRCPISLLSVSRRPL